MDIKNNLVYHAKIIEFLQCFRFVLGVLGGNQSPVEIFQIEKFLCGRFLILNN